MTRRSDLQRVKSRAGVEARRRKRLERADGWTDAGGFVTDGVLGVHSVRLWRSETYGERLAVTVDGEHRQARTLRGFIRCMAEMAYAGTKRTGNVHR